MRSVNVKRIAAAAAGAAMLGAAVAGAVSVDDMGLGSFPFYSNGEPNVKIVVGTAAQPSDAVAAANIAAMVGNLAYTSKDITVLGITGLTCTGGTEGTAGVASGQVTASVTTPGVNPNVAYQMKSYIEGYLDYLTTDDRTDYFAVTGYQQIMPTSSTVLNYAGRKVTNYETPLSYKGTISDTKASKSYTEEERYFLYSNSAYDTVAKQIKGKKTMIGYEVQFTDPIPICTNATPSQTTCTSKVYESARHHIQIKFLRADWIIYGMDSFNVDGGGTSSSAMGSSKVTLGKEVAYNPYMSINDEITAPNGIKVKLTDISSFGYGTVSQPKATFKIYNSAGTEIDTAILQPTDEYNDNGIVIHLYDSTTGVAGTSSAEISVFSEKLELIHNSIVNTDNSPWRVTLWGGGSTFGGSLARIQLSNVADVPYLMPGEYMNIIKKPAAMKLTFNGKETPTSVDTLSFNVLTSQPLRYDSTDTTTQANVVQITSTRSNAFQFASGDSASTIYYVIGHPLGNAVNGSIYYYKSGSSSVMYNMYNYTGSASKNSASAVVRLPLGTTSTPFTLSGGTEAATGNSSWTLHPAAGFITCFSTAGSDYANYSTIANVSAIYNAYSTAAGTWSSGTNTSINTNGSIAYFYNEPSLMTTTIAPIATNITVTYTNGSTVLCNSTLILNHSATNTVNGTLTGVTIGNYTTNYVAYNYGPTSLLIGFDFSRVQSDALAAADLTAGNYAIYVPEYTLDTDTGMYALKVPVGGAETASPMFAPTGSTAYIGYGYHITNTPSSGYVNPGFSANTSDSNYESGFITRRGSTATIGTSAVSISYPSTLSHALYTLSAAGTDTTSNTATVTSGVGGTLLDNSGYIVNVTGVGGSCGTGTAGEDVGGTESLTCSETSAYTVTPMDTSMTPLVVFDASSYASGTQPLIVVGGPIVNTVAASTLSGGINPTDEPMVKVVGDKIVVAGYTAADTTSAANALIEWLSMNSDVLQR